MQAFGMRPIAQYVALLRMNSYANAVFFVRLRQRTERRREVGRGYVRCRALFRAKRVCTSRNPRRKSAKEQTRFGKNEAIGLRMANTICAALGAAALLLSVRAQVAPQAAEGKPFRADSAYFEAKVRPILQKNCLGCHGVGGKLGGLDMRSRESALRGGGRGAALVPGDAAKSLLFKLAKGARAPVMPPYGKLASEDLKTLKTWIDGGAVWGATPVETAKEQVWWSFQAPKPPKIPSPSPANWIKNPIDAFVLEKLRSANLSPSPAAPRRALIRRAYLDVIGLPPTPKDVEDFLKDKSANAYEKVVDALLASPRYGERWGRHWLDLARYADSGGFEGDRDRQLAWKYRDYVIAAFNSDKPYNLFLREQLAGDELRPNDPEALIATGYLACGPQDIVEMNARTRANELDDLVATTGSAMLGLTIGCARCHDHKYDPVKMTDYYRLSAVFAPTERREADVPTPQERQQCEERNAEIEKVVAPLRPIAASLQNRGKELAIKAKIPAPNDDQIAAALPEADRTRLKETLQAIQAAEARRIALPHASIVTDGGRAYPASHILLRGDAYHKGGEIQPGFIHALPNGRSEIAPPPMDSPTTRRRSALADWIVSPQNPLTARVWVNRVWRWHFGRGIVNSPSNFGLNGETPSHPELLDWLALKFQEFGWRTKPLHKLILLSSVYRQASDIRPAALKADPQNRLYWRTPLRRLEAEAIRDGILSVAGTLNLKMGGAPVYPPIDPSLRADTFQGPNWFDGKDDESTWRRSVYVKVKRSLLLPHLEAFDCPEITYTVAQRNTTTTPLQALLLLNDPLILHQAQLFAERLRRERPNDLAAQTDWAFQLALGRSPSPKERALIPPFIRSRGETGLTDFCQALFNLNEFVYSP